MSEISLGIRRLKGLKELIEKTMYDSSVNVTNRYTSCVSFADDYNKIVEDTISSSENKVNIPTLNINRRNPYDMLWSQQKTIMEKVLSAINESAAILENALGESGTEIDNRKCNLANKLFISHSTKDGKYVEAFVKLLESLGFNENNLFCSYLSPYNIPTGEDIYEYLHKQFNEYKLHMVFVLSQNYYKSVACQNEVGAAWLLRNNETILFTPNFDFSSMEGALSNNKIGIKLDDPKECRERLNDLKNKLIKEFDLKDINDNIWERNRDEFIRKVVDISEEVKDIEAQDGSTIPVKQSNSILKYKFLSNDDRFVAYYINTTKKKRFDIDEIIRFKNSNEFKNIDINNGIDIMKDYGLISVDSISLTTTVTNDAFMLLCDDDYIKKENVNSVVERLIVPASIKFEEYLSKDWLLNDYIILFFKFIFDTTTSNFYTGLAADRTIKLIKEWENECLLNDTVSSNYDKILEFVIENDFVYETEWTDYGNPLRYKLFMSIVDCLNSKKFEKIVKDVYFNNKIFK